MNICNNCKYHGSLREIGEHRCFKNSSVDINPVTGERKFVNTEDCEIKNKNGNCNDFTSHIKVPKDCRGFFKSHDCVETNSGCAVSGWHGASFRSSRCSRCKTPYETGDAW